MDLKDRLVRQAQQEHQDKMEIQDRKDLQDQLDLRDLPALRDQRDHKDQWENPLVNQRTHTMTIPITNMMIMNSHLKKISHTIE